LDFASTFHAVVALVARSAEPIPAWTQFIAYLESQSRVPLTALKAVEFAPDVRGLASQLQALVEAEPPPPNLNAIYFGLFDTADDDGVEGIGFYVSGVEGFDPEDGDSLCGPAWWPDGRYLQSAALDAIRALEVESGRAGKAELASLLGYAGQLGAAMLLAKFASRALFDALKIVVGFDSGDYSEIQR
jgi:hypothetical protein